MQAQIKDLLRTQYRGLKTIAGDPHCCITVDPDMSVRDELGVVGWCEGVVYLALSGRPTDIGLQLGKACYPCSR